MRGLREQYRSELIVVEGDTEEAYIGGIWHRGLARHLRGPLNAKGGHRVQHAMERTRLDDFTRIWIVMDAEKHPHRAVRQTQSWTSRQAKPERFVFILTAPKIEAWLLAHYEPPSGSAAQIEARLVDLTGFVKGGMPDGFPKSEWEQAADRLPALPGDVMARLDSSPCPLCLIGSALPQLVKALTGS